MANDDAWFAIGSLCGLHELRKHVVNAALLHHELCLEGSVAVLTHVRDDIWAECEVRHKVSIHDVKLDAVHPGIFQTLTILTELSEVGGQHGWDDLHLGVIYIMISFCGVCYRASLLHSSEHVAGLQLKMPGPLLVDHIVREGRALPFA